jgi:hypothetical protein
MIGPEMLEGDLAQVTCRLQAHCAEELKLDHHAEFRA